MTTMTTTSCGCGATPPPSYVMTQSGGGLKTSHIFLGVPIGYMIARNVQGNIHSGGGYKIAAVSSRLRNFL